ncbi:MAG: hypothetical protein JOZ73_09015 [Solirubrobacterales bacterium]|nr:hypothetical protein [Solirubrobacterales bacterium]
MAKSLASSAWHRHPRISKLTLIRLARIYCTRLPVKEERHRGLERRENFALRASTS